MLWGSNWNIRMFRIRYYNHLVVFDFHEYIPSWMNEKKKLLGIELWIIRWPIMAPMFRVTAKKEMLGMRIELMISGLLDDTSIILQYETGALTSWANQALIHSGGGRIMGGGGQEEDDAILVTTNCVISSSHGRHGSYLYTYHIYPQYCHINIWQIFGFYIFICKFTIFHYVYSAYTIGPMGRSGPVSFRS